MMKVLVIGGGIGGLTTAIALQHFGFDVEVFEAAPELNEVGAGLWLSPNAMKVYDLLGLREEIEEHANTRTRFIGVANIHGEIVSKISCSRLFQRYGFRNAAIHCGKLQSLLKKHVLTIFTGKRLTHYTEDKSAVTAHFTDGSSAKGDILVGADGMKSVVRETMFGPTKFRYSGQTCWRFVSNQRPPRPYEQGFVEILGDKKGLRVGLSNIENNEWYTFITLATAAGGRDEKASLKKKLLGLCENFPQHIKDQIISVSVDSFIRNDIYDFAPLKRWYRRRVALVGDAAHATTPNMGQGACQAIESAFILAKALYAFPKQPRQAFQTYQDTRIRKAHFVTKQSWNYGIVSNISAPILRWLIETSMKWSPSFFSILLFDRMYRFQDKLVVNYRPTEDRSASCFPETCFSKED